jgi:hypothetical protein
VKHRVFVARFACLGLCLIGSIAFTQPLFKWIDEEGNVHYGDHVPPEYANRDRDILNSQGITVGSERGALTDEERAALERRAAEEEQRRLNEQAIARRDQMLLATYLSVEDIEELRDERIELLASQIRVTEQYLASLNKQLDALEREAARHESAKSGQGIPADLEHELSRTKASIALYEENLTRTRIEQQQVRETFAADIERFIELKGDPL